MPINHTGNTANGNKVKKLSRAGGLTGRLTGLSIPIVKASALCAEIGEQVQTVIAAMRPENDKDLMGGFRQPTDHEDRDGNLPVAPGKHVQYREYNVPGNACVMPGFVRLVADNYHHRIFITPTHYDMWVCDNQVAAHKDAATAFTAADAGVQNPFFLIELNV
jgi:hypothetical protein